MWPASNDSPVRCLFERSSEGSVVPRLSDLEPGGRRSWPLEASRPPWFGVARWESRCSRRDLALWARWARGERGAGLMSAGGEWTSYQ